MLNVGDNPVFSDSGLSASLAWRMDGRAEYVLEGNINYSCAVIKWLVDDLKLLKSSSEAGKIAKTANPADSTYLAPAFTGLGAPHWRPDAKALMCGMTRTTGLAEIVRAAEECIAYQIADIVRAMEIDSGVKLSEIRADGGAASDDFLMQFQSDIINIPLIVSKTSEISAYGVAVAAGRALGIYDDKYEKPDMDVIYKPDMPADMRNKKLAGWADAIEKLLR
jgi:glycerol kinase